MSEQLEDQLWEVYTTSGASDNESWGDFLESYVDYLEAN